MTKLHIYSFSAEFFQFDLLNQTLFEYPMFLMEGNKKRALTLFVNEHVEM